MKLATYFLIGIFASLAGAPQVFGASGDLVLTGWGTSQDNGLWISVSDINSNPAWSNGVRFICATGASLPSTWYIGGDANCTPGAPGGAHYYSDSVDSPELAVSWTAYMGAEPIGSISFDSETTVTVATTTAQQDAGGIAFGLAILTTISSLGVVGFIFNSLNKK